jgi:type IV secretion system protein VirD4
MTRRAARRSRRLDGSRGRGGSGGPGGSVSAPYDRRHAGGATPIAPWVITGLVGLFFVAGGLLWVAARLAAAPGHRVPAPTGMPAALARTGLDGVLGDQGSPALFGVLVGVQVLALLGTATAVLIVVSRRRPRDGRTAMGDPAAFTDLQHPAMARRAQGLRPSLADTRPKTLAARQIGAALGDIGGATIFKSFEDVELVICGPRSNKTSAKVVPEVLAAPGAVVATSNKGDVWTLTAGLRAQLGPVWLFDPNHITYQPQTWWWDLLSCVVDVDSADRMAGYFMREVDGGDNGSNRADPFFTPAARKTLRQILLAAACTRPAHTLRDVRLWVATRSDDPAVLLERGGHYAQAAALRATLELPPETRGGIYEGVATAIACLDSEPLLRWVTPPHTWEQSRSHPDAHHHEQPGLQPGPQSSELSGEQGHGHRGEIGSFDLRSLITTPHHTRHPTLYLLSREGQGTGRPIVAAMVGELFEVAKTASDALGGRLDPPLTVQLDEAANIVRIPELPAWYSWFGSKGVVVTTVLQSREQGRAVWGRDGFEALWGAATIKTVGAGVADPDFAEDISRLIGDHKVTETSTGYASSSGHSINRSLRTERILTAADVAALPRTHAVLIAANHRPGLLALRPWYAERDATTDEITTQSARAITEVQRAARAFLPPDHPVIAALHHNPDPHPSDPPDTDDLHGDRHDAPRDARDEPRSDAPTPPGSSGRAPGPER